MPSSVPVLVLPHARIHGLSADPSKAPPEHPVVPLLDALRAEYLTDAHVQLVVIDGATSQPRINKPALARLRADGVSIRLHAVFVDFDAPGHTPSEGWRHDFACGVDLLKAAMPWSACYQTRGGARLVWSLARPLEPEEYEHLIPALHAYIDAVSDLHPDAACKDWTRLYRLPFVRREGVDQRLDLVIGDGVLDADAFGIPEAPAAPEPKAAKPPRSATQREPHSAPQEPRDWQSAYGNAPATIEALQGAMTALQRAERWMAKRDIPEEGERNLGAYKTACALACRFDLDEPDIARLVGDFAALFPCESNAPGPLARTLQSAWEWSRTQERGTALREPSPMPAVEMHTAAAASAAASIFDVLPPGGFPTVTQGPDGPSDAPEDPRRTVVLLESCRSENTTEATEVLSTCLDIFVRQGALVHMVDDSTDRSQRGLPWTGPVIKAIKPARLAEVLARGARWLKNDKGGLEPCGPPQWLIDTVFARDIWPGVRRLEGVVSAPCLRPDGSLLSKIGYDDKTGLILATDIEADVPGEPTDAETAAAVEDLLDVLCDFPFEQPAHRSVALAAILSPFARTMTRAPTPLFLFDASTPAAGKGLLATTISSIALGRRPPVMTPADADEERKRIIALAMMGASMVLLDEYERLDSPTLRSALTEGRASGRPLGGNDFVDFEFTPVWMAAANNAQILGDMPRRVLPCRLAPTEERPEERSGFKHDPLIPWVLAHRAQLVSAALTVLRAYICAGRPKQAIGSFGSFDAWSDLVRSTVVWLGEVDPVASQKLSTVIGDERVEALKVALSEWWSVVGRKSLALGEIELGLHGRFSELSRMLAIIASEKDGAMDKRKVGQFMRRFRGRAIGGFRLESTGHGRYGQMWTLTPANETNPPSRIPGEDDNAVSGDDIFDTKTWQDA